MMSRISEGHHERFRVFELVVGKRDFRSFVKLGAWIEWKGCAGSTLHKENVVIEVESVCYELRQPLGVFFGAFNANQRVVH